MIRGLLRARIVKFALTGTLVAIVYLVVTSALSVLAGAPTQLAVIVGYVCSLAVHFTVNRRFVFASSTGYALHLSAQGTRYLTVAFSSYALTALLVALSRRADIPELVAALGMPVAFAAVTFLTLRGWVFRAAEAE
jgi:putative flippase GtrA